MKYKAKRYENDGKMKLQGLLKTSLLALALGWSLSVSPLSLSAAEKDGTPEIVNLAIKDGKVNITVQLNEPFRWEKTRCQSIKTFQQPFFGLPETPHEIWLNEEGSMELRQTDMMFMGTYRELQPLTIEASLSGFFAEIIGVFDPETNLLRFDQLDYVPFFQTPNLVIEASTDLKLWSCISPSESLPSEYPWPEAVMLELSDLPKESAFYRIRVETLSD